MDLRCKIHEQPQIYFFASLYFLRFALWLRQYSSYILTYSHISHLWPRCGHLSLLPYNFTTLCVMRCQKALYCFSYILKKVLAETSAPKNKRYFNNDFISIIHLSNNNQLFLSYLHSTKTDIQIQYHHFRMLNKQHRWRCCQLSRQLIRQNLPESFVPNIQLLLSLIVLCSYLTLLCFNIYLLNIHHTMKKRRPSRASAKRKN